MIRDQRCFTPLTVAVQARTRSALASMTRVSGRHVHQLARG